jgi:hypothetical protein
VVLVLSTNVSKNIVVGCRTDCRKVMSVETTAIATNNKGFYKMMSFSAEQTPSEKTLVLSTEQTALPTMSLSSKQTAVTK